MKYLKILKKLNTFTLKNTTSWMKTQNKNFYMIAKTMFGLEEVLMEELRNLGAQDIKK